MKLRVFNSTKEALIKQKYPIFIGISVGIKPMSKQLALSYMDWALHHASGPIQILIADKIAQFNYLAFSHYTKNGSLARAIRDGDKYENFFNDVLSELPKSKRDCFQLIRWQDIESPQFFIYLERITEEFNTNIIFKNTTLTYAEKYIERRGKIITSEKKLFLCQYILHELAALLRGIDIAGKNYRFIIYPSYQYSGMSKLVQDIQSGIRFPALQKELNLQKTIMVEFIITKEMEKEKAL